MTTRTTLAALLLGAFPTLALAAGMAMDSSAGGAPSDAAFAASMSRMMNDMAVKPTGNPDADFVRMMVPHHQGAIDMAKIELRYGKDPALRALAAGIVKAQQDEIAEMRAWQAKTVKEQPRAEPPRPRPAPAGPEAAPGRG